MKIVTDTPDLLIVEDRPVLLALGLIGFILAFVAAGLAMVLAGEWWGLLFAIFGGGMGFIAFWAFVRRVQVVFHRPEGYVELRRRNLFGGTRVRHALFVAGTEPTAPDTQFQRIAVDTATGRRATDETPPTRAQERVYWMLPPEYHDWMVSQGIPLAPPDVSSIQTVADGTGQIDTGQSNPEAQLVLTDPTSNTAYQLHPGLPAASQRIRVGGYSADGRTWATLRLVKDGATVLQADDAARLTGWWTLTPGAHSFWLEGEADDGSITRSAPALVVVDAMQFNEK